MTMPDTPALAALREAEREAFDSLLCTYAPTDADVERVRDAVAARVRGELLVSGTPLWVQDDGGHVYLYTGPDATRLRHECAIDRVHIWPDTPLREPLGRPGPYIRAVLTILPEEGEGNG